MNPTNKQLWRRLRLGDRVRLVHLPNEFSGDDYTLLPDTLAAYRKLIANQEMLTVSKLDEGGYPWVEFTIVAEDGVTEFHSLMLNHDGIEVCDG